MIIHAVTVLKALQTVDSRFDLESIPAITGYKFFTHPNIGGNKISCPIHWKGDDTELSIHVIASVCRAFGISSASTLLTKPERIREEWDNQSS